MIKHYIHKAFTLPPQVTIKEAAAKIGRKVTGSWQKKRAFTQDTHWGGCIISVSGSYISVKDIDTSKLDMDVMEYLCQMYLEHRFDLLGSGWVKNSYDSTPLGLEGYIYASNLDIEAFDLHGEWLKNIVRLAHVQSAQKVWQELVKGVRMHQKWNHILETDLCPAAYCPVDWQKDYKSGYRYDAKRWYRDQPVAPKPGVDIKVPWELARMQHLPQMAIAAKMFDHEVGQIPPQSLILEFRNLVLDFIASNPPRMGVNWYCSMDVGIRAANMLVAYDLFLQLDRWNILDEPFRKIFAQSIYEHGRHIVGNLEWSKALTSNHYLSNIAGLLFVAAYLDQTQETDSWLAFAVQEIVTEFFRQFLEDGANFEASTCYHRLSGELMVFSIALILGLGADKIEALCAYDPKLFRFAPKFKTWLKEKMLASKTKDATNLATLFNNAFVERLYRAGMFTVHLTKPTGEIPQIGDNDSGRFFRFSPNGCFLTNEQAEDQYLNLKGYNGLFQKSGYLQKFDSKTGEQYWDENSIDHATFVSALNGLFGSSDFEAATTRFPLEKSIIQALAKGKIFPIPHITCKKPKLHPEQDIDLPYSQETIIRPKIDSKVHLTQNLHLYSYPDTGIYIFRSDRMHLTISAGPNGQNGIGGHSHNDKLSFELNLDGEDIVRDPGTYLYTPLPERRNEFRSVKAHNMPWVEEYGDLSLGLFRMENNSIVHVAYFGASGFVGIYYGRGNKIFNRRFFFGNNMIVVKSLVSHTLFMEQKSLEINFSPGYGKLLIHE